MKVETNQERQTASAGDEKPGTRQPYEAPVLEELGALDQRTQGVSPTGGDVNELGST